MAGMIRFALLGVVVVGGGCRGAVAGYWELSQAVPSPEVFALDDVTFERDGTYRATVTREGRTTNETGQFSFNGLKLTLRPAAGGQRSYTASVKLSELRVIDGTRRVVLRRAEKPEVPPEGKAAEAADPGADDPG